MVLPNIASFKFLRKLILPILAKINIGDIKITHHYTGDTMMIHSYMHKGYWYYGKSREKDTMEIFMKIIKKGDSIIEIGGHIGYISLYFSKLVGDGGKVFVFEPGINNWAYISSNVKQKNNITLLQKAAGSENTSLPFYIDNLSGQNNSLIKGFEIFKDVKEKSYNKNATVTEVQVDVIKIDDFISEYKVTPNFIKVDAEGYELEIIKGMLSTIDKFRPSLMVEITYNFEEVFNILSNFGYIMIDDKMNLIKYKEQASPNVFCIFRKYNEDVLSKLGIN